jgi:hypothetical protein
MSNITAFHESLKHQTEAQSFAFPVVSNDVLQAAFRVNNLIASSFPPPTE